jgi:hypothetical protein
VDYGLDKYLHGRKQECGLNEGLKRAHDWMHQRSHHCEVHELLPMLRLYVVLKRPFDPIALIVVVCVYVVLGVVVYAREHVAILPHNPGCSC